MRQNERRKSQRDKLGSKIGATTEEAIQVLEDLLLLEEAETLEATEVAWILDHPTREEMTIGLEMAGTVAAATVPLVQVEAA